MKGNLETINADATTRSNFSVWIVTILVFLVPFMVFSIVYSWYIFYIAIFSDFPMLNNPFLVIGSIINNFFPFWLYREVWFKWNVLEFSGTEVVVRRFLGLGRATVWDLSSIEGYTRSVEPSRPDNGIVLNLYIKNRRSLEISRIPYLNFQEIEQQVESNTKFLGYEDYSYLATFKNCFGFKLVRKP